MESRKYKKMYGIMKILTYSCMKMKKSVLWFLLTLSVLSFILLKVTKSQYLNQYNQFTTIDFDTFNVIGDFYSNRKDWVTSNLGSILFKNQGLPQDNVKKNKIFVILVWKYWDWLKNRHIHSFGSKRTDPLDECSVRNCRFVGNDKYLETADAVLVHLQKGLLPKIEKRNPLQRWVFLSDEAPTNTFSMTKKPPKLSDLANIFNWSMTYRIESDVPVPYGRTIVRPSPMSSNLFYEDIANLVPNWKKKRKDVLAAVLMSNCAVTHRMNFLKELKEYISIDIHGKCSNSSQNICPGHFKSDCEEMTKYLFYLVLENSMCKQYLTEKSFYHAYSKGAIPVIKGPPLEDCKKMLPPNSYLHVDNYATVKDLAKAMIEIGSNEETLLSYHSWRNNFEVLNEHGYFGSKSYHLCRLCEAMNYNDDKEKVYSERELRMFLDQSISCH